MNYLQQALELQKQLDGLRPILATQEAKIMQKFRLDWNYHSNHLEGNSLTYGETKMLLLHGITSSGKPLKDSLEIKGHDEAIKIVEDVVKNNSPLSENFIRQLHQLLLKESYEVDAITPDGKATKKLVQIGKYKETPNHVKTKTGEMFYFSEPFEVPAKMQDLIKKFRAQKEEKNINPIILAAVFHYEFVRIHPFDDGNGRLARILMNFILMQFGFPPAVIKTGDKENYFLALRYADSGEIEKFIEYVAACVVGSLEIMIKGAKGEEIEEEDDIYKKVRLLRSGEFEKEKDDKIIGRSEEEIKKIFDDSVKRFYDEFLKMCDEFKRFYLGYERFESEAVPENPFEDLKRFLVPYLQPNFLTMETKFQSLKKDNLFYFSSKFYFDFESVCYKISSMEGFSLKPKILKNYGEQLTNEEIKQIINAEAKRHFEAIEKKLK